MIVHSREELCRLYVIIKKVEIGKSLVFLDVLIISSHAQGPGPMQSQTHIQSPKCWTVVKVVCIRKVGEAAW